MRNGITIQIWAYSQDILITINLLDQGIIDIKSSVLRYWNAG